MRYQSLLEVDCAINGGGRSLRLRGEQTEHMREGGVRTTRTLVTST